MKIKFDKGFSKQHLAPSGKIVLDRKTRRQYSLMQEKHLPKILEDRVKEFSTTLFYICLSF